MAPNQKRDELLAGSDPVIIVSCSGMLTGGPSAQYAQKLVSSENACIIITGYQDEEAPGRQLLNCWAPLPSPDLSREMPHQKIQQQDHAPGEEAHPQRDFLSGQMPHRAGRTLGTRR